MAGVLLAFGRSGSLKFYQGESISLPGDVEAMFLLARTLIYTFVFVGIFAGTEAILENRTFRKIIFTEDGQKSGSWWSGYVALGLGWLPILLIKYPGALCWDTWQMIHQYKIGKVSEFQSVYYTVLLGKMLKTAENAGHANWGLFAFCILNYLVLVAAMGCSIQVLRDMKITRIVRIFVILMYLMNPYITGYVGVLSKDVLYTPFMVFIFLCLIEMHLDFDSFVHSRSWLILLFISVINAWLIRRNGSYIMIAAAVLLFVRCLIKKLSLRPVVVMAAACVVSVIVSSALSGHYHAAKGNIRETLSLPFQQTARYVKLYGDEVTDEERQAIDAVLPYDELAERYDPRISDPVKGAYKNDSSKLPTYFKVWFKQFLKHPLCYVSATWEQNYYLLVPEVDNIVLYQDTEWGYEPTKTVYMPDYNNYYPIFSRPAWLGVLQRWLVEELRLLHRLPVVRLSGNVSFWFYVLLYVTVILICHRTDMFLPLVFLYFTIAFVLLGPVIQGHPRYMFPVVYAMPVMLLFMIAGQVHGENKTPERR